MRSSQSEDSGIGKPAAPRAIAIVIADQDLRLWRAVFDASDRHLIARYLTTSVATEG
jgi:hypothetical protein